MRNTPQPTIAIYNKCYPIFYFILLFNLSLPFALQSQSLYDQAILLDSLYGKMDENDTAAKAFFDVLEELYVVDETLEAKEIDFNFSDNKYMSSQVHQAWKKLSVDNEEAEDKIAYLKQSQKVLYKNIIDQAKTECEPKVIAKSQLSLFLEEETPEEEREACTYQDLITNLEFRQDFESLNELYAATKETPLGDFIKETRLSILQIDSEIIEINAEAESSLLMEMNASGSMPFRSSAELPSQAFAPIIISQQGGGSIQSSIIDGTSQWIAERMREELSIAFFDRFENWVDGKNIKLLFPNAFAALGSSATTDYALMIQIFKSAFEKDLKQLPFNFSEFIEVELSYKDSLTNIESDILDLTSKINLLHSSIINNKKELENAIHAFEKQPIDALRKIKDQLIAESDELNNDLKRIEKEMAELESAVQDAYKALKYVLFTVKAIRLLSEGQHPTTLLSYLNENVDDMFPHSGNVKSSLLILDVVSRSLISLDEKKGTVWASRDALVKLKDDAQFRDFYFGLVYQEIMQTLEREKYRLQQDRAFAIGEEIVTENFKREYYAQSIARTQEVERVLTSWGYNLMINMEQQTAVLVDTILAQEYYYDNSKNAGDVRYALGKLHENLRNDEKVSEIINPRSAALLAEDIKLSLEETQRQLNTVFTKYQLDGKQHSIRALIRDNLSLGSSVIPKMSEDSLTVFLKNKYEEDLPIYLVRNDIPNTDAQKEIKAALDVSIDPIIKDIVLGLKISPILGAVIDTTMTQFYGDIIIPDSVANVEARIVGFDDILAIDLAIIRLNSSQVFIDSLLRKRSFGKIINGFMGFANKMDNIHSQFNELKKNGNANLGTPEFVYLMRNSLDALHQIYELSLPDDNNTLNIVQGLTTRILDAYAAVLEKDYDAVVMNIIPVADSLLAMCYPHDIGTLEGLSDNLRGEKQWSEYSKQEIKDIFKEALKEKGKDAWNNHIQQLVEERDGKLKKMHEVFKYGAFLAAVVQSRNADEIKSAIRAVALPAGSYSIKRRTYRNISLNSYPGVTGGMELASNNVDQKWAPNFGFTAPLGLGFSWGYKANINGYKYIHSTKYRDRVDKANIREDNRFLSGHSGTIFVSLIDLGAIVLFRLDNNEEAFPEDITFQQIFSPGVIYAHGLRNVPITLMGGLQVSPQLRSINDRKANSFRFNFSVVVDLPLGNLYTSRKY